MSLKGGGYSKKNVLRMKELKRVYKSLNIPSPYWDEDEYYKSNSFDNWLPLDVVKAIFNPYETLRFKDVEIYITTTSKYYEKKKPLFLHRPYLGHTKDSFWVDLSEFLNLDETRRFVDNYASIVSDYHEPKYREHSIRDLFRLYGDVVFWHHDIYYFKQAVNKFNKDVANKIEDVVLKTIRHLRRDPYTFSLILIKKYKEIKADIMQHIYETYIQYDKLNEIWRKAESRTKILLSRSLIIRENTLPFSFLKWVYSEVLDRAFVKRAIPMTYSHIKKKDNKKAERELDLFITSLKIRKNMLNNLIDILESTEIYKDNYIKIFKREFTNYLHYIKILLEKGD